MAAAVSVSKLAAACGMDAGGGMEPSAMAAGKGRRGLAVGPAGAGHDDAVDAGGRGPVEDRVEIGRERLVAEIRADVDKLHGRARVSFRQPGPARPGPARGGLECRVAHARRPRPRRAPPAEGHPPAACRRMTRTRQTREPTMSDVPPRMPTLRERVHELGALRIALLAAVAVLVASAPFAAFVGTDPSRSISPPR